MVMIKDNHIAAAGGIAAAVAATEVRARRLRGGRRVGTAGSSCWPLHKPGVVVQTSSAAALGSGAQARAAR